MVVAVGVGGFGDTRLACVGAALLASMQTRRTLCLHRLGGNRNRTRRFSRFLENPRVTRHEMLTNEGRRTGACAAGRHVLAIEDTTELHFPTHAASKRGFGKAGNGEDIGLFLHPVMAVDAQTGGIVGLVDCAVINRAQGKVSDRKKRPAEGKESRRWLEGARAAADALADAARITLVADREGDIYDLFARRPASVDLLCRSAQNRVVMQGGLLSERCARLPEQDRATLDVPPRGPRPARRALVALRFGRVTLTRPSTGSKELAPSVALWGVDVTEIDPPAGAEPVHWRLLTTHAVATTADARQILAWYRRRWCIEQVFRSMKSHTLRVEDSQMLDARGFTKLAMVALIAAVRAMQLVLARDGGTAQAITDAVDAADMPALEQLNISLEGRTTKLKNPHGKTTLAWLVWIVARLGGWSGYTSKGYKPAGPKTIHHGLLRLEGILAGWKLAHRSADA